MLTDTFKTAVSVHSRCYPVIASQIPVKGDTAEAVCLKKRPDGLHLSRVCFKKEYSAGQQIFPRLGNYLSDDIKPVFAAIQGDAGLPPDFGGKGR